MRVRKNPHMKRLKQPITIRLDSGGCPHRNERMKVNP
jgi:hypothetical protein